MVTVLDRIDDNAKDFSKTLMELATVVDGDLEQVIRLGVLKLFAGVIKRSPVDTGMYRSSHGISNTDPGPKEAIRKGEYPGEAKGRKGTRGLEGAAWDDRTGWTWRVGDGTIFMFNNVPYALRLEEGHSTQAGAGIYAVMLAEIDQVFREEIDKTKTLRSK